ncbi:MAG: GT4 family glycosyltransferase PelF [Anaerolineae bacterium]
MSLQSPPRRASSTPLAVAFLTEGTYPFSGGGVSSWCNLLLSGLPTVDFHVVAATSQPYKQTHNALPANVRSLIQVPLWGASPADSIQRHESLPGLVRLRVRTTDHAVRHEFVPALRTWLGFLYGHSKESDGSMRSGVGYDACSEALVQMACFLRSHDYGHTFRSQQVWDAYADAIARWYRPAPAPAEHQPEPSLAEVAITLQWLAALLRPLAITLPRADVYHATGAVSVSLMGIVAQQEKGTPFLLTEHGVYLRERAISVSTDTRLSFFQKHFLVSMADAISQLCYHFADLVTPVCSFNAKWERNLGTDPRKIRVIYNAIDTDRFVPLPKPVETFARPTVVAVGNITPFKDILTLIRAAALVRAQIPDVCFLVYGSLSYDPDYTATCQKLIRSFDLDTTVTLAGLHPQPELIYAQGDLTVLSSISEAFPFAVLESMACGRPVVATDVGGVVEAVGHTGLTVPPRSPAELAEAIVTLLNDPEWRQSLGAESRMSALQRFHITHLLEAYNQTYAQLAVKTRSTPDRLESNRQGPDEDTREH